MKNILKSTFVVALASAGFTLTGCIDEVEPTSSVSQEQLDSSIKAAESGIYAMPGFMPNFDTSGYYPGSTSHIDFGYSSFMHVRDCMTGDMPKPATGLDRYSLWGEAYVTDNLAYTQLIWNYYYKQILSTNIAAKSYELESENQTARGARSVAMAFRAMLYLDLARWFEFLPNEVTSSVTDDGNDVLNLTVPIVTEETTEEDARNNPRATHKEMFDFILSDLTYAAENIKYSTFTERTLPNEACVYGLLARLYMWDENYAKAAEYAELAIKMSGRTPLSEAAWTDPASGFNTLNNTSWMWGMKFEKENDAVITGICNWTSMLSSEAAYGYAGAGAFPMIDAGMYARISDTDFRKLSWVAPAGSELAAKVSYCNPAISVRPLVAVKFRPGEGNYMEPSVGSATAVPIMRVEEMYFIYAEALAHTNAAQGKAEVEKFMKAYRDPEYTCEATDQDGVIEEIVFQKRVELWGEGQSLFDIKRLNYSVTRAYAGTNWRQDFRYNTNGRPAWMNMVIIRSEGNNNKAIQGWNNPNFADLYTPITGI